MPAGTTAALRFEVQGIVGGEPRIVVEHITRLHPDAAPDWPDLPGGGGYDIIIEGSPRMRCTLTMEGEHDGDHPVSCRSSTSPSPAACASCAEG